MDAYLPAPYTRIGGKKFWRRRSVREYLALIGGQPPPPSQSDDDYLMGSLELRMVLGGVSDMWILRHSRRSDVGPAPAVNRRGPDHAA